MTNMIGMALAILGWNVETNYVTNNVCISCEEAGCTLPKIEREVIMGFTAKGAPIYGKEMGCILYHTKPVVTPASVVETITVGVPEHWQSIPLFDIVTQKVPPGGNAGGSVNVYLDGTWIVRRKEGGR